MPMPESLYGAGGAALVGSEIGALGAGRLGIRLSFAGSGPGPFIGTGGGALGFSKLPSWLTWGNRGLAGGLMSGDRG